jgi:hypothetical protein
MSVFVPNIESSAAACIGSASPLVASIEAALFHPEYTALPGLSGAMRATTVPAVDVVAFTPTTRL